jgi:hypothetical protein
MIRTVFLVLALLQLSLALYGPKSDVVQVGENDFKTEVLKYPGVVAVEFYAPW